MVVDGCFWTVQAEDFQEHILGGVILVYICYSEQSACNLTKRRTLSTTKKFSKIDGFLHFFYATKDVDCIPLIKTKHNFFKNTFFPSAIIEWNKLDLAIRNAESLGIFKSNILKFFRPTPKSFFNSTTKELDVSRFSLLSIIWWWNNHSPEHSK